MRTIVKFLLGFILLSGVAFSAYGSDAGVPHLHLIVNDFAHLVDEQKNKDITNLAFYLNSDTGADLAVATFNTSQPLSPVAYTDRLYQKWQGGRGQNYEAALLALYVIEREFRIKVSPAVARYLPEKYINDLANRMFFYMNHGEISDGLFFISAVLSKSIQDRAPYPLTYYPLKTGEILLSFGLLVSVLMVFLIVTGILIASGFRGRVSA